MIPHDRIEWRMAQQMTNIGPGPVGVTVAVAVAVGIVVARMTVTIMPMVGVRLVMSMIMRNRLLLHGHQKPVAGQSVIAMIDKATGGQRTEVQRRHGGLDLWPVFRKSVQQRSGEHIPGPAAERIEMNIQRHPGVPRLCAAAASPMLQDRSEPYRSHSILRSIFSEICYKLLFRSTFFT
jgi:hypothetical protein